MALKILLMIAAGTTAFNVAREIKNIYAVRKSQKELDRALKEYHEAVKQKNEDLISGRDAINLLIASMNEAAMKGWRE